MKNKINNELMTEKLDLEAKLNSINKKLKEEENKKDPINNITEKEFKRLRSFVDKARVFVEDTFKITAEITIHSKAGIGDTDNDCIYEDASYAEITDINYKILKISDSKFFNRSDASNILDVIDEVVTDTDSCINEDIIAKIVGSKIVEKLVKQNMSFINKEIENSAKENNLDKDLLYKIVMYYSTLKEAKIQES
jgi:hypothetical protein